MRLDAAVVAIVAGVLAVACEQRGSPSPSDAAGTDKSARTRTLEAGAALLQGQGPLGRFDVYLDGFHFANGRPEEQAEAHHYCQVVNEDFRQCVLFDGNAADAKLVGIEYVVSRRVFEQLPMPERSLWHSHAYEVTSGLLIAPGLPQAAEHALMEQLAGTYGKTWHTWHTERDRALPAGIPALMAGFTGDDQVDGNLVRDRDSRFDFDTDERRAARNDIQAPGVLPGADAWQYGESMQLMLQPVVATSPALHGSEPERDEAMQTPRRRSLESRRRDAFAGLDPILREP
jgi:hypothetical protein